jgi:hypothetical protein
MLGHLGGGDGLVAILDFDPAGLVLAGHGTLLGSGLLRSGTGTAFPRPAWLIRAELGSWVEDALSGRRRGEGETLMYIGIGTVVLIVIIVLVILMLRRR